MDRYICIHGHFYQPPRENPWLESVEIEDSASPFHDWNERVTAECYGPNATSRILEPDGRIDHIVSNYERISFDFGPTLLSWLESQAPEVYQAVLDADRESRQRYSGHGAALAQAYNHAIMPLANERDKRTQVIWGIRDFRHRFGREPEGMWLPETAVDTATLEILAEHGITFTILSPHQARRIRSLAGGGWSGVSGGGIDPTQAYRANLPSGRAISLFFYDAPVARAVAFENLLADGGRFATRLAGEFNPGRPWSQLVHIASDGETYGHHQRFGNMALAYALHDIDERSLARTTVYGEYLERHPPATEVEIVENTSWSCAHGIERWRADCGCSTWSHPGWNQAWRAPMRQAFDWLRDTLSPAYEGLAERLFTDPCGARDDYIDVILGRTPESVRDFLAAHARQPLDPTSTVAALKLLEMQRHLLLMYTSCGWFFDDISGLEAVQVIQYASRAIQLAQELFGQPLEDAFTSRLAAARSNLPDVGDGRHVYQALAKSAMVDLKAVGAHYAINSIFVSHARTAPIYSFAAQLIDHSRLEAGRAQLLVGHAAISSTITYETTDLDFAVLHLGDHNVFAGVGPFRGDAAYAQMEETVSEPFRRADFPEVIRQLDHQFEESTYSLRSLFRDDQRRALDVILRTTLAEVEASYREIYEDHAPLIRFLADLPAPIPAALRRAAESILVADLRRAFDVEDVDEEVIRQLVEDARAWQVDLAASGVAFAIARDLAAAGARFRERPEDFKLLSRFDTMISLARTLPFDLDYWTPQNDVYRVLQSTYPGFQVRAANGDETAKAWVARFTHVADLLRLRVA